MKIAMIKIPPVLAQAGLHGKMLLQVHDELVVECPRTELSSVVGVVREVMENTYLMDIPLTTEARWGMNWDELQPMA
jgi:DNA polymerase-1